MQIFELSIAKLTSDPNNARKHDERNLLAIAASLKAFGQQKPIVVNKDNVVIAGSGTLAAAQMIGLEKIQVVFTELVGDEATAFALADNRTAELAAWDNDVLSKTLAELKDSIDLESMGFDESFTWPSTATSDPTWEGMPEYNQNDEMAEYRLIVNFETLEDLEEFARLVDQPITETTRFIWYPRAKIEKVADKRYAASES